MASASSEQQASTIYTATNNYWVVLQIRPQDQMDMAALENGRITTASPPCPGVTGSGVYDAEGRMYFGYHESGDDGRNGALLQVTLPSP